MKNFFTLFLLFLSLSGLFAQSECIVKIGFVANKTNPITYSFKTDPFTDGAKYYWNFSDGQISDNPNPTKSFKETGTYSVTVKVSKNDQVCTGKLEFKYETGAVNTPVIITGKGKVKKLATNDGCGLLITLDNGTVIVPKEMVPAFEFKDGQYVELAYELFRDKSSGCPSGIYAKIDKIAEIVQTVCNVPITFAKSTSTVGTYTFKTAEQPSGAKYLWYFGDQGTSNEASPTFTFNTNGTYSITLKVTDAAGKTCSNVLRTAFEGKTSPVLSGKGKVKKLALAGCDLVISLDNNITLIPVKMVPDFVLKENQYVELTYEKLGEKTTSCNEGSEAKILTIKEITNTTTCKAYFTASNQSWADAAVTKKVVFTNQSAGDIKECLWYFGDNTTGTSTSTTVTHEYANDSEYKACLVITTLSGCKSDYCTTVKVGTSTSTTSCSFDLVIKPKTETPNTFVFYAVSKSEIKSWSWKFGDGKTSDAKNPEHAYEKTGTYEVSCTITTIAGCTTNRTVKHTVLTSPVASCKGAISLLLFDPTDNQCNGKATVKLLDENAKEIANVAYLWSDGRTGSTVEKLCPDKTYTVQAIIEGVCQKNTSFTLLSKPIWRASAVNGQNNFTVVTPKEGVEYEWNMGNGIILKGAEINYDFANDGVYNVTLKAVSGANYSEYSQQIVVMKSATGTNIINKSELKVFPNPVKNLLNIDFGNPLQGIIQLQIMNITGERVLTRQLNGEGYNQTSLDVRDLRSGIYFVRISANNQLISDYKFIKGN